MSALSLAELAGDVAVGSRPEERLRRMLERHLQLRVREVAYSRGRWYASVVIADQGVEHTEHRSIDELLHGRA